MTDTLGPSEVLSSDPWAHETPGDPYGVDSEAVDLLVVAGWEFTPCPVRDAVASVHLAPGALARPDQLVESEGPQQVVVTTYTLPSGPVLADIRGVVDGVPSCWHLTPPQLFG